MSKFSKFFLIVLPFLFFAIPALAGECHEGEYSVSITGISPNGFLAVKAEPSLSAKRIAKLPADADILCVSKQNGDWLFINVFEEGHVIKGWVHHNFVKTPTALSIEESEFQACIKEVDRLNAKEPGLYESMSCKDRETRQEFYRVNQVDVVENKLNQEPLIPTMSCATLIKSVGKASPLSKGLVISTELDTATYYLDTLPNSDKVGGSTCSHAKSILAECLAHRDFSVMEAIQSLLVKATAGKKLPTIGQCGV